MFHRPAAFVLAAAAACTAHASLTLLAGPSGASHVNNLVTNGSFEIGAPVPDGFQTFWANPLYAPYSVPTGWSSSGTTQTYARWGNDGPGPATIQGSDLLPDGRNGLYFGNYTTTVDQTPTFHPNGRVTFAASPNFAPVYGGACVLTQTIPTNTFVAPSYLLSFWTSGENAAAASWPDGIFGLRVTNVLAGDPMQYLAAPSGTSSLGASHRYDFSFVPLNPLLPVTVEFYNWGHLTSWPLASGGSTSTFTTELCLDDVIVNPVPTPGALPLLALAALTRRRARRN